MASAPKTRNWSAWIDLMPGKAPALHVRGKVETNAGNFHPDLKEAVPQGINPSILILDLTIVKKGEGGSDDVAYRDAIYDKPAKKGQYTEVHIRFGKDIIEKIKVTETH